jgi:hypothetical protein
VKYTHASVCFLYSEEEDDDDGSFVHSSAFNDADAVVRTVLNVTGKELSLGTLLGTLSGVSTRGQVKSSHAATSESGYPLE